MLALSFAALIILLSFQNCGDPEAPSGGVRSTSSSIEQLSVPVPDLPFKARVVRHPDHYIRKVGQMVTFTFELQSEYMEAANITWYHNGAPIKNEHKNMILIGELTTSHAGSYKAIVKLGDEFIETSPGYLTMIDSKGQVFRGDPGSSSTADYDANGNPINYNWSVSSFSQCSVDCGVGQVTREVHCTKKPENLQVEELNCSGQKPESQSECDGARCSATQYTFTDFGTQKTQQRVQQDVKALVTAKDFKRAERSFSSLCDQGQLGCGLFDRCKYLQQKGLGDAGEPSFCTRSTEEDYLCIATCERF